MHCDVEFQGPDGGESWPELYWNSKGGRSMSGAPLEIQ
jgi:hypothetical protein